MLVSLISHILPFATHNFWFIILQSAADDIRSVSKSLLHDDTRRERYLPNHEELSSKLTSEDRCCPLAVFPQKSGPKQLSIHNSGYRVPQSLIALYACSPQNNWSSVFPFRDSVLSLSARSSSSCTIVCEKRSDYTCTSAKSFADRGMQWKSMDSEVNSLFFQSLTFHDDMFFSVKQDSPASNVTSSLKKETKDSAVMLEYDEHDVFAKTIAAHLRSMDVETALKARNQIDKVITDHRLHKPETVGLDSLLEILFKTVY